MERTWISRILITLVVIAALVAVGLYEYRAGVAHGLAISGKLPAVGPGGLPYPYWGGWGRFHPFGFIFPLLFVVLIFALSRRLFWSGRHWGPRGGGELPPDLDEWHRKAHETMGKLGA